MAKDRIERDELASKLTETASSAEDPLRAMAELLTDFVMEAEVTAKVGAEVHERSAERTTHRNGHRERRWDTTGNTPVAGAQTAGRRLRSEFHRAP
jgi:transposase-like protein